MTNQVFDFGKFMSIQKNTVNDAGSILGVHGLFGITTNDDTDAQLHFMSHLEFQNPYHTQIQMTDFELDFDDYMICYGIPPNFRLKSLNGIYMTPNGRTIVFGRIYGGCDDH